MCPFINKTYHFTLTALLSLEMKITTDPIILIYSTMGNGGDLLCISRVFVDRPRIKFRFRLPRHLKMVDKQKTVAGTLVHYKLTL